MSPDRWERISEIYHSALEIEQGGEGRRAFLDEACAGDAELRREVESLLAAHSLAGNFIAEPIVKNAVALLPSLTPPATGNAPPPPPPPSAPSLAGKILGHYEVLSRIGAGGMGEVYLAKDTRLDRLVALKTLPLSFAGRPEYLRRFQTEAKAAATLNHPNAATVYSVEEIGGQPLITMEFVRGKTLSELLPQRGLDLKTFLAWFVRLSDALCHAHEKGVVHRDIKPGNIMITEGDGGGAGGVPKILDFGLAQIDARAAARPETPAADGKEEEEHCSTQHTAPGQVFGTPAYMSPEQAEGQTVDHRSDIFSFGVVMYRALTGERPFKGESQDSVLGEVLRKDPAPVTDLRPDAPFLLARLITKCLQKDRRERFQSMREVRVILEEIKAAVDAGVSMDSSPLRPPQFALLSRSNDFSHNLLFASLALLPAVAVLVIYLALQNKPQAPPIAFENAALRKLSQTGNVVYAHVTPDGKSVVYNTIEPNEDRAMWIRRVEDKNALQLLAPQPVQFWGGITISPDASQIYYITAGRDGRAGTLHRVSSLGGATRKLAETVNDLGSLSPDGRRVLFVRYGAGKMQILSADSSDGSDERVVHSAARGEPDYIFRDPQFSADGRSVFFIKFERINGEEFWSLAEIPADGEQQQEQQRQEKIIIPPRKPRISEIVVLKDGSGLFMNATDGISNLAQLFHVSLPDGAETRITNDLNAYFGISASDDARTIVAAQRNFARDVWTVSGRDAKTFRKLTAESNVYSTAVWTPDGGRIVFDALDNNRPHVWIMNADGTNVQQLTPNDSFDYEPRVSPDGRSIVFTSRRSGDTKVWRMNIDGGSPQLLTPFSGAAFAPLVVAEGGRTTVLFQWIKGEKRVWGRVALEGSEITERPAPTNYLTAVSPDGKKAAYAFYDEQERRYKVRVRPLEAEEPSAVFNITPVSFLVWAPDGKSLLYREIEGSRGGASNSTVWQQMLSGGEPKEFLNVKPDSVFNLSFAAGGGQGGAKRTAQHTAAVVRGTLETDAVMLTKNDSN